jgi:hypothetical protein
VKAPSLTCTLFTLDNSEAGTSLSIPERKVWHLELILICFAKGGTYNYFSLNSQSGHFESSLPRFNSSPVVCSFHMYMLFHVYIHALSYIYMLCHVSHRSAQCCRLDWAGPARRARRAPRPIIRLGGIRGWALGSITAGLHASRAVPPPTAKRRARNRGSHCQPAELSSK